ncbi:MAG: hypothetical protein WDN30_16095 [Pararobbsia sp.]
MPKPKGQVLLCVTLPPTLKKSMSTLLCCVTPGTFVKPLFDAPRISKAFETKNEALRDIPSRESA